MNIYRIYNHDSLIRAELFYFEKIKKHLSRWQNEDVEEIYFSGNKSEEIPYNPKIIAFTKKNLYIFQISYVIGMQKRKWSRNPFENNPLLSEQFDDYLNTEKAHYLFNENNYDEKATLRYHRKRMSLNPGILWMEHKRDFLNTTEKIKRYGFCECEINKISFSNFEVIYGDENNPFDYLDFPWQKEPISRKKTDGFNIKIMPFDNKFEKDFPFSPVGMQEYTVENIHPNIYIYGQERRDTPIIIKYLESKL